MRGRGPLLIRHCRESAPRLSTRVRPVCGAQGDSKILQGVPAVIRLQLCLQGYAKNLRLGPLGGRGSLCPECPRERENFFETGLSPFGKKNYKAFPRAFGCKPVSKLTVCRRAVRGPIPRGGSGGGTPPGESPAGENFFEIGLSPLGK